MYYSYVEIEYIATSFSPARMDLALKLLTLGSYTQAVRLICNGSEYPFDKENLEPMLFKP
jgi:hypothetical protein